MRASWLLVGGCVPHLFTRDGPAADGTWAAPENGWEIVEPPAELVPEGFEIGQTVPDLRLVDQFGDEVSLWQFHGNVILLDVSTIWCGPCQDLGEQTEETWQAYRDRGFVYLTVLQENYYGDPPTLADVRGWIDLYEITAPVVADGDLTALGAVPSQGGAVAYPGLVLIGRDLKVVDRELPTDPESVDAAVREAL